MIDSTTDVNDISTYGQFVRKILVSGVAYPQAAMFVFTPGVHVFQIVHNSHVINTTEDLRRGSQRVVIVRTEERSREERRD